MLRKLFSSASYLTETRGAEFQHKGDFGGESLCQTGSVVFVLCKKEEKKKKLTVYSEAIILRLSYDTKWQNFQTSNFTLELYVHEILSVPAQDSI